MRQIIRGRQVDLTAWLGPMAEAAEGPMTQATLQGIKWLMNKRRKWERQGKLPQRGLTTGLRIDVPEVPQFVRGMAVNFAKSTNDTSEYRANEAAEELRRELAEGLDRGELHRRLTDRVHRIFRNPERASMIAHTEQMRALHGGQWLAAKQFTEPMLKLWLASSDACPLCLDLDAKYGVDGIPLDQPFATGTSTNPAYSTIMFPPRHPNCFCTYTLEVDTNAGSQ